MKDRKVLIHIVDDQPDLVETLEDFFSEYPYQIESFYDGQSALEALKNCTAESYPDLILSDMRMPGYSGLDLLKDAHSINPNIKFILFSGYLTKESCLEALYNGASNIIEKPFGRKEVVRAVEKALGGQVTQEKSKVQVPTEEYVSEKPKQEQLHSIDRKHLEVLVADDDPVSRKLICAKVKSFGYKPIAVETGIEALKELERESGPDLAILDWMMPEMSGLETCRKIRSQNTYLEKYIIMLSSKNKTDEIVQGLEAGANDYLTKPVEPSELKARLNIGTSVLNLYDENQTLKGLIPICGWCKNIRKGEAYWQTLEGYLADHGDLVLSHGICPDCQKNLAKKNNNKAS